MLEILIIQVWVSRKITHLNEGFSTLKNINNLKKLNKSQIILAKSFIYFEYFDKGISLEKSKILDDEIITNALKSKIRKQYFVKINPKFKNIVLNQIGCLNQFKI